MKTCKSCLIEYELSFFEKEKESIDGHRHQCRKCRNEKKNQRIRKRNIGISVLSKKCNKCQIDKPSDEFHRCKSHYDGLNRICKICRKDETQLNYQRHKESIKQKTLEYYKNNKEKIRPRRQAYQKHKESTDILFRLSRRLRNRLYYALKRTTWEKGVKFNEYIGCSLEELKIHLEKQFQPGMSWDNYGSWHVDHISPLSKATTEHEMYSLCHWYNLQPMWAKENIKKGNK